MTVASSPKTHGEHPQNAEFAVTLAEAEAIIHFATKDKAYQSTPLGEDVAVYLRARKKRLTPATLQGYEGTLHKLVVRFPTRTVEDFDTETLERFLDDRWGVCTPGTYNVCLTHVRELFKFWEDRDRIMRNPANRIEPMKEPDVERTIFQTSERHAILDAAIEQRDRIALRLLLDYGLRKGALRAVQFRHFDYQRRELTIFTKGQKIRRLPLPDPVFWTELERLTLETEAQPHHWLMYLVKQVPRAGRRRFLARQMSSTAAHRWWYRHLERAGLVAKGAEAGEKMHKARHTAGQRVLDATGDVKLVQQFLGHASISTTADVYTHYDNAQIAERLALVVGRREEES